jgi:hypothetical protein
MRKGGGLRTAAGSIVDRRGEPAVVIMSLQDFLRTSAPPPDWLEKAWSGDKRRGLFSLRTSNEALILTRASSRSLVHPRFSKEILEDYAAVLARLVFAFPSDDHASQSPDVGFA